MDTLEKLGRTNLDEIEATVRRYKINCDFQRTGELHVATADWQMRELSAYHAEAAARGLDVHLLDRAALRAEVDSPTYLGGVWDRSGCAMVDPARRVLLGRVGEEGAVHQARSGVRIALVALVALIAPLAPLWWTVWTMDVSL
jgi:hypothetical protein